MNWRKWAVMAAVAAMSAGLVLGCGKGGGKRANARKISGGGAGESGGTRESLAKDGESGKPKIGRSFRGWRGCRN